MEQNLVEGEIREEDKETTFEKLGVCPEICDAVAKMHYKYPSKIQS